jgi:hypothetical protein
LQGFLLSDAMPFSEVLPFKASLRHRLQDLLLSVPTQARQHPVALVRESKRRIAGSSQE